MAHAKVENSTPFAYDGLHLIDEQGRPVFVTLIRAAYTIRRNGLTLAEPQPPIPIGGVLNFPDAAVSSWRFEPETAVFKPTTDVVVLGSAYAPRGNTTEMDVGAQVGTVAKAVHVVGDRVWTSGGGMTRPQPFERIPLVWERAFGGWDRTVRDKSAFEPRNPVGTGYRSTEGVFEEGVRLPNLEHPQDRLTSYGQIVTPVGYGFTSADWQPRAALGGTHDQKWIEERMPLVPADFDRRFYNAGAPGLVTSKPLRGDETVNLIGMSPLGDVAFRLPGARPPQCRVQVVGKPDALVETVLDTVVIAADEDRVFLTYRGHVVLANGPHDVKAVEVRIGGL